MKQSFALTAALFSFFAGCFYVSAADVGLFDISDSAHPKPFHEAVGEVRILSMSNDNKTYYLSVRAATVFSLPCTNVGLVVGSNTIRFDGQGHDYSGAFTSMETEITDPEVIPDIAKYFHVTVFERHHPGNQMLVEFLPQKAEFTEGDPILVWFRITNIGDHEFKFLEGGRSRMGTRDNNFAFTAEAGGKMMPDIGNPKNYGGLMSDKTLRPGSTHERVVDLSKWFDFKEPGTYNLRGSFHMEFVKPDSQEDLRTIWEDYACAEFTVIINRKPISATPGNHQ